MLDYGGSDGQCLKYCLNSRRKTMDKLNAAIAYLRERKIYLIENKLFVPTNVANTDVAATIRRYRQKVQGVSAIIQAVKK